MPIISSLGALTQPKLGTYNKDMYWYGIYQNASYTSPGPDLTTFTNSGGFITNLTDQSSMYAVNLSHKTGSSVATGIVPSNTKTHITDISSTNDGKVRFATTKENTYPYSMSIGITSTTTTVLTVPYASSSNINKPRIMGSVQSSTGEIYITGLGDTNRPTDGGHNAYVAKLNSSGALIWQRSLYIKWANQNTQRDYVTSSDIAIDSSGNSYICGKTIGDVVSTGLSIWGAFVVKLDPDGNVVWSKIYQMPTFVNYFNKIEVSGNQFIVSGNRATGVTEVISGSTSTGNFTSRNQVTGSITVSKELSINPYVTSSNVLLSSQVDKIGHVSLYGSNLGLSMIGTFTYSTSDPLALVNSAFCNIQGAYIDPMGNGYFVSLGLGYTKIVNGTGRIFSSTALLRLPLDGTVPGSGYYTSGSNTITYAASSQSGGGGGPPTTITPFLIATDSAMIESTISSNGAGQLYMSFTDLN